MNSRPRNSKWKIRNVRKSLIYLLVFFSVLFLAQSSLCYANPYWVSANGQASWSSCSSATPLSGSAGCSLGTANANAQPGDTVYLRSGTYDTRISPSGSGTSDNERIVFRAYEGEQVILTPVSSISLTNKQFITIAGIKTTIGSCSSSGCYILLDNSNNIVIENGVFDIINNQSGWPGGIYLRNNAHHNIFRNNKVGNTGYESSGPQDAGGTIRLGSDSGDDGSGHNLFQDNELFNGGHHVVEVYTSYNAFRNNILHNDNWYSCSQPTGLCGNRNFIIDGPGTDANWNLIENNRIAFAGIPADSECASGISLRSGNNIIRYNAIYYSSGPGISIEEYSYWSSPHDVSNNHIYSNTFFHNGYSTLESWWAAHYGMLIADQASTFIGGLKIKNNIFHDNQDGAIAFSNGVQRADQELSDNIENSGDPLFVNKNIGAPNSKVLPDLSLQKGSQAIDAGGPLTTVAPADTGTGTSLIVADAGYFQDGSWAPTIQADWIAVGTVNNTVSINSILGNTITLANPIARNDNDPVWLYKRSDGVRVLYGSAPDIGAYEYHVLSPPGRLRIIQ